MHGVQYVYTSNTATDLRVVGAPETSVLQVQMFCSSIPSVPLDQSVVATRAGNLQVNTTYWFTVLTTYMG